MIDRHRTVFIARCLTVLLAAAGVARAQGPATSEEYELKAAFLFRFPQFVEWPAASLTGRDSLEICVAPPNPFGAALQKITAGESVKQKPIVIRDVGAGRPIDSCHLLFLGGPLTAERTELLKHAASKPILTVGDAPRFLDEGGIINLRVVDRKVRFDIDAGAADRAGLRLSSQLLRLAVDVRGNR